MNARRPWLRRVLFVFGMAALIALICKLVNRLGRRAPALRDAGRAEPAAVELPRIEAQAPAIVDGGEQDGTPVPVPVPVLGLAPRLGSAHPRGRRSTTAVRRARVCFLALLVAAGTVAAASAASGVPSGARAPFAATGKRVAKTATGRAHGPKAHRRRHVHRTKALHPRRAAAQRVRRSSTSGTSTSSSSTSSLAPLSRTATSTSTSTLTTAPPSTGSWNYDFEDGSLDGWSVDYGPMTLANSSTVAFSGSHSLALKLTGKGNPAAMSPAGPAGIAAGTVLTYHLFEPAGLAVRASLYAVNGSWGYSFASSVALNSGGWTTLTYSVPALVNGLRYIGIEIENGGGATGTLYLDAIGWKAPTTAPVSTTKVVGTTSSATTSSTTTTSSTAAQTTTSSPTTTTSSSSTTTATGSPMPVGDPGSWHLVFDDEFNGSGLDSSKWSTGWFGSGITGGVGGTGENDCYDPAQAVVSGGELDLNLIAASEQCSGTSKGYATGFVTTDGLFSYSYGFAEARIWLPGSGSISDWPSFWQDGQSWPADGELDILEGLGGQACAHWHGPTGNGAGYGPNGGTGCPAGSFTGGWHTFGADWEPGIVTWYYDGKDIGCIASSGSACGAYDTTITGAPQYLILGMGIGSPALAPVTQRNDYVRVWQH